MDCHFLLKGCHGGRPEDAFAYIKSNGGLDTEKSYPYEVGQGKCHFDKSEIGATVSEVRHVPSGDEKALMQAVIQVVHEVLLVKSDNFSFLGSC